MNSHPINNGKAQFKQASVAHWIMTGFVGAVVIIVPLLHGLGVRPEGLEKADLLSQSRVVLLVCSAFMALIIQYILKKKLITKFIKIY